MNYSISQGPAGGLYRFQRHWADGVPGREQVCALTERRISERRCHGSDYRHREFRLRAAVQVDGIGLFDFDYATGGGYFSPQLSAIAGLPEDPGEISLERLMSLFHPDDRERVAGEMEAAMAPLGDGRIEGEYRLVRPDGPLRWVKVRGRVFFADEAPGSRVLGVSGIVIDITERRDAEKILREQSEELRLALRVGNSGTFQWDARTHEHRWCNEMLALYGLERHEFGGRDEDWLACLLPEDRAATWAEVERSLETGEYNVDFRIQRRNDGKVRWMNGRGQVYFDPRGDPRLMIGINVDITDQKRVEAKLERSGARLRAILDSLSEGVVVFDLEGQVLDTNPAARRIAGCDIGTEADRRLPKFAETFDVLSLDGRLLPFDDWPIGRVVRGESFTGYEIILRRKDDGRSLVISNNGTPVRNADGEPILGVITLADVTERKRTEEALYRESSRLQAILDNAPVLISIRDLEARVLLANRALFETVDVPPPDQFIGRSIFELFPEEIARRQWANDQQALECSGPIRTEEKIRHRDGGWHTYLTIKFPVLDISSGNPQCVCAISIDITEGKAAEAQIQALNAELEKRVAERTSELQRANEALLKSNADLKQIAHATAHDLQTPLRSIAGFTQLLQQEVQGRDERVDEWSSLVVENARRLQMLIQELISYTRLDVDGLPFEQVDLGRLVENVRASLAVLVAERGAEVTSGDLPTLPGDRLQLAQVLQSLIENGIKYNHSQPPRVSIACEHQEGKWLFSVADNGIGIDPRHHDRIFEIFRRLHAYHQVPGTGIGLALCRRIVERHGGRIWVESRPGEGSTFHFTLPDGSRAAAG